MKVSADRLEQGLKVNGFRMTHCDHETLDFRFSRRSCNADIFRHIWVSGLGRKGEAVAAKFGEAVVAHGNLVVKGLGRVEHVTLLDSDKDLAFSNIETTREARVWERNLLDFVCHENTSRSVHDGMKLNIDLMNAVRHAHLYEDLMKVSSQSSIEEIKAMLFSLADKRQILTMERICEWIGVVRVQRAEEVYASAVLGIVLNYKDVEKTKESIHDLDPLMDIFLFWRIQILTDRLISRFSLWSYFFC